MSPDFELPLVFDLGATGAFALTGALAGIRRGYDVVGLFFLALASGVGGGLIRDGILLRAGPPVALTHPAYLITVAAACGMALLLAGRKPQLRHFARLIFVLDGIGLGAYAVVGVQKSLHEKLGIAAALLIGVLNATGGGLLRDVLAREEPFMFKPGEVYALVALAGATCFCLLHLSAGVSAQYAAIVSIAVTLLLRILSARFNWRTRAMTGAGPD